jgi:hypothetical protein
MLRLRSRALQEQVKDQHRTGLGNRGLDWAWTSNVQQMMPLSAGTASCRGRRSRAFGLLLGGFRRMVSQVLRTLRESWAALF